MKPYDELTLEEKQDMLRVSLKIWANNPSPYKERFSESVATTTLWFYIEQYTGTKFAGRLPNHQVKDIISVLHSLPEHSLYPSCMDNKQS